MTIPDLKKPIFLRVFAAFLIALLLVLLFIPTTTAPITFQELKKDQNNPLADVWITDLEEAFNSGKDERRILMVDLAADWCEPCERFEKQTFSDPNVQKELMRLIKVRLDFNTLDDKNLELNSKYNILGLPTILFMSPDGRELPGSRIEGFLNPNEFILHLNNKVYQKLG